jgi:hypothetical protein
MTYIASEKPFNTTIRNARRRAAEHAHAANRFAHEIIAILAVFVVRLRQLMGRPLAGTINAVPG